MGGISENTIDVLEKNGFTVVSAPRVVFEGRENLDRIEIAYTLFPMNQRIYSLYYNGTAEDFRESMCDLFREIWTNGEDGMFHESICEALLRIVGALER